MLVNEHAHLRKDTALKSTRGLINNSGLWLLQLLLWMIAASCSLRELGKNPTRLGELLAVEIFIQDRTRLHHVSNEDKKHVCQNRLRIIFIKIKHNMKTTSAGLDELYI